ncbi:MAG: Holliday junction resolvase RuvX [Pseudomonadota bacterium]|nr:Holliday junction resolvase RuvX [Pseudomonadota bacterium]
MSRPAPRTVLGFDYGRRRIGVAVGQELTGSARPLALLAARRQAPDWDGIGRLIREWRPDLLVVGVPRHADGSASATTTAALDFARHLAQRYGLAVDTIDERLSSKAAAGLLEEAGGRRRRTALDPLAAALILESWLRRQGASPQQ